uniref:Uncharacterized protein n=2 Tax=Odontella aurita TaxID=265563 RepID=A0A7S4MTA2_9STRA|mmetsp:Transcript_3140/g.8192  ORF Transcript_3140/g.8192 Transcript_3140/m.8192 type:complete len:232 (+) Transcript_3140:295-990(+)
MIVLATGATATAIVGAAAEVVVAAAEAGDRMGPTRAIGVSTKEQVGMSTAEQEERGVTSKGNAGTMKTVTTPGGIPASAAAAPTPARGAAIETTATCVAEVRVEATGGVFAGAAGKVSKTGMNLAAMTLAGSVALGTAVGPKAATETTVATKMNAAVGATTRGRDPAGIAIGALVNDAIAAAAAPAPAPAGAAAPAGAPAAVLPGARAGAAAATSRAEDAAQTAAPATAAA